MQLEGLENVMYNGINAFALFYWHNIIYSYLF